MLGHLLGVERRAGLGGERAGAAAARRPACVCHGASPLHTPRRTRHVGHHEQGAQDRPRGRRRRWRRGRGQGAGGGRREGHPRCHGEPARGGGRRDRSGHRRGGVAACSGADAGAGLVDAGVGVAAGARRRRRRGAINFERLMNESAAGSSSKPDAASLDLSFSEDGRSGTFMIGNQRFPASLLDLPTVVESYKTYDDSFLVKIADIGQMVMVREEDDPAPEGAEYKHGLTPPMRDARRRRFCREPDLSAELVHRVEKDLISIMQGVPVNQNASVAGGGEGGDRKKAAPAPAPKPNVQEPDRSDSDESDS
ncbi:hypothetical protein CFC21_035594 [Triticum aestivum]|uniref:TAFII55 protein conserved region domain-containing protein n=2 Tax=Triticum aestivum TaxID=4565 RepID=A0A3B6EGD2_WHEAT|nr:uncharacterized protein LOC119268504 isoform X1 [Triticum dicoccoides]XP_044340700.1 uncharacterized protein LOC123061599 isoform X2 [Triticum aestivum]KAF7022971.1 hypothetical protein CFC21_035594 [Triticum aestivum]